jgi:tetratricopeptide (TPR) repeat protein
VLTLVAISVVAGLAAPGRGNQGPESRSEPSVAALTSSAYEAAFNLDHDQGIALARQALAEAPTSARAHRTLASMLWMKVLFGRGAVTVDHYASGMSDAQKHLPKPDAAIDKELHAQLARAIELAEARLEAHPEDLEARYEAGAAYGLQASYTATIDASMTSAFRTAKRAFDAQERVLEGDPNHALANVTVGTYRYVVSALGLPSRWLAYLAGFGGGKDRGILMVTQAFADPGARVEAGTSLLLIYSREGRHADAYRVALALADAYPRNRLFILEAASAAVRAGLAGEAESLLTAGLERLAAETRPKIPGERAIWLYQLGQAQLAQNRPIEAQAAYQSALKSEPHGWMRGRIRTGLGKTADLAGRRDAALAEYERARTICEALDDVVCRDEAKRLQRRPFAFENRRPLQLFSH